MKMEGFMAQKGLWNLSGEKILRGRGALPQEEGDAIREYRAMHEEFVFAQLVKERWKRERRKNGGNGQREKSRKERKEEKRLGERRERNGNC